MVSLIHAATQTYMLLKALIPAGAIPLSFRLSDCRALCLLLMPQGRVCVMVRCRPITELPSVLSFVPLFITAHLLYQTARHMLGAFAPYIECRLN